MSARHRIVIVEDHQLLAEAVGIALAAEGFEVSIADLSGHERVLSSATADSRTLVLLDLDLGDPICDGTTLIPAFVAAGAAVLVLTGVHDRMRLAATLEAGAAGYLCKDEPFDTVLSVIFRAASGEPVIDPVQRQQLLFDLRQHRATLRRAQQPFELLTPRESQVLAELMRGKSVEAIAADWVVSPATVRSQVRGILTKLGVASQLAAVAKARAAGWEAQVGWDAQTG